MHACVCGGKTAHSSMIQCLRQNADTLVGVCYVSYHLYADSGDSLVCV